MTGRSDWETPQYVFCALDREFRFDLDGAASETNAKCARYLSDAFEYESRDGETIWVNPPYVNLLAWVQQFDKWAAQGATVVALLLANTDTDWFKRAWQTADEIRFVSKRIQFIDPSGAKGGSNNRGSLILVWRGRSTNRGNPRVSLVGFGGTDD